MGPMYALSVGRWWRGVIALGLVAVGLILSGAGLASAATCQRVQTPNVETGYNSLRAVSVTSSRNAWAVGDGGARGLIEHWNGKAWKIQPSPTPRSINSDGSRLWGVTATSARNAWAVGVYY